MKKEEVIQLAKEWEKSLSQSDFIEKIHYDQWTTLLHELHHSYQATFLFQEIETMTDEEEDAENYSNQIFETHIRATDYVVLH